ncbi:hypothetical protein ABZ815_52530 [Nonomuraea sp. NPDC047529]|uniref:hypothetical protein n=1 Tax=Nonomuraea sp. NPDC047529 TaxID=3155623 RepID=UPI0033E8149B
MAAPGMTRTAAQLTADEVVQCYLATHGRVGARMARMAMNGDIEACFHLGLLTLLRDCDHDGMIWLRRAAEAGHEAAAALQGAHDPRTQAADVAYRHGCALEAGGAAKASIARCFYQLAAETGHPEAVAKITGTAPSPPPQPPATPMTSPAFDISVPEPPPQLLDDASLLSCQLGLPQQHLPHMIESLPEQTPPAVAPPAPSRLMQSPVAAQAEYGPAWPVLRDLAGALKTAAAQAQDLEEAEGSASFAYTCGDPAADSHQDLPTWLFETEQPPFPPWPDGQPP